MVSGGDFFLLFPRSCILALARRLARYTPSNSRCCNCKRSLKQKGYELGINFVGKFFEKVENILLLLDLDLCST